MSLLTQQEFLLKGKPVVILTGNEFLVGSSNPVHIPATNQGVIAELFKIKNPASSSTYIIRERKFPGLRCKDSNK